MINNESGYYTPSQHLQSLLKWHPIKAERVSVDKEARKSVFMHLTKLKTRSLSAFEKGLRVIAGLMLKDSYT